MIRLKSAAALLLVFQLVFGTASHVVLSNERTPDASPTDVTLAQTPAPDATPQGLRFRLSEGADELGAVRPGQTPAPTPDAVKLSDAETRSIYERLPPLKTDETDTQEFNLRERSLPPPRAGQTVLAAFPATERRDAPDSSGDARAATLKVLRHAPTGEVPLAPELSVTFSQPMVAVTSQAELAAAEVPVRLTPQPAGRWRWLGTKTLIFQAADQRLPMATEYRVTVPAGTRAATGATLAAPATWSFATPPPKVIAKYPEGGTHRRDALMFVAFDQRINPEEVLRTIKVRAVSGVMPRLRLASEAEIAADANVKSLAAANVKGRWLAFRAVGADGQEGQALPGNTAIVVSVGPGTPSAEGARRTTQAQDFTFRTYGPLRVTGHECGGERRCTPFDDWHISLSNQLDAASFTKEQVRITPELPDARIEVYGENIWVRGMKRGRTLYRVTIDASVRDQFGQTLGAPATVEFNVGAAPPTLTAQGGMMVVLDPSGAPEFPVYTTNHSNLKVTLHAVAPEDWPKFLTYMRQVMRYEETPAKTVPQLPGRQLFARTIPVKGQPEGMTETRIDLSQALTNGLGHAIVKIEPTVQSKNRYERQSVIAWVQVTGIGLDAFADRAELLGWATSLKDGRPLAGVEMSLLRRGASAQRTGADGLARFALTTDTVPESGLLIARLGADAALLPEYEEWWQRESNWVRREASDTLRWYVFDDRKMYRPGEEVRVKGWLRRVGGDVRGDVGALSGAAQAVSYSLQDARGNQVTKGTAQLNPFGGFDLSFKLPPTINLGHTSLQLYAEGNQNLAPHGRQHYHALQVQEFRRPEFEVKAQADEGPHFVGAHAQVNLTASYYAGGGLPNSTVVWKVSSVPGHYTPPNRGDFTFGKWIPWWSTIHSPVVAAENTQYFGGTTDAGGKHRLRIDFDGVNPPQPSSVTAQASVTDVNRQTWTATTTMLVHPADLYVGMRSERTFVQQGEPLIVQTIVTDLDGKLISNRQVKVRAALLDWVFERGEWRQQESDVQECSVTSRQEAVKCTLTPKKGGTYRVTATVRDDRERLNESELTLWVAGGKRPPQRNVQQETVELIPDRKDYRAGDVAEILVQPPFYPAEGVMTLRRSGLVRTERFRINEPSHTLRIPIEEAYTPNLLVQVDLVGASARTDDKGVVNEQLAKRPAFAKGELNLSVPPLARKLQVVATPKDKAIEPGGETSVAIEVKDAAGRGVEGSELAVVVVDEAVLALTNYRLEDPLALFYAPREGGVNDYHLRKDVLLADPGKIEIIQSGNVGGAGTNTGTFNEVTVTAATESSSVRRRGRQIVAPLSAPVAKQQISGEEDEALRIDGQSGSEAIRLRADFNALAVFAPSVRTDARGRAEVKVKVPDNLTRYRVMAVSVAGDRQFGSGESAITARTPLMVRPSAPRFLNFGDRFELPVVLQNQTDAPMDVRLAVRAANATLTDGAGRRVTVPANDRVEVRFPTSAERPGTARFQVGAVAGRNVDAAEISLPVWTPATTEAFATYGQIDAGSIVQPVTAPAGVFTQFGGLEITTSSTELQALTDAVLYLVSYPYECSEQLSSRVLAVAALRDVLSAFKAQGMPSPDEMKAAVTRDVKRLQGMQNDDGGFGFWRRGEESWPYVSIHVAHALTRAKEKGFDVPQGMLDKSRSYLKEIERRIPSKYSREARQALIAYALYVRARMNDRDAGRARRLIAEAGLERLSLESTGWLLFVLSGDAGSRAVVEAIRRHLNNRATETAGTAQFTDSYGDADYLLLHSSRRADGVILESLIVNQPDHDLIPKLVRGLLAHRKQGRWSNTQENVFILLALDRYFNTYEKVTPDFVARAWLGQTFAGSQEFRGRTTDRQQVNVPMRYLAAQLSTTQNLVLAKEGAGRLYYRIGMQYAPASLKLDAADFGFTVERIYEAVENPADVRRDPDGTWRVRAGAQVRVRLTMVAPARRYHVALVDPLPAGLEPLNPALAVTGDVPADRNPQLPTRGYWWFSYNWFQHQNLRDERVEAFTPLLWEGVYNYSYVARATTPGTFVVPPPKAEEMYHPETFGRGSTDRLVVE
ncbi:MAG TPA: alpha-2-macroglobulin family protein [Pyrinomonadaceae bacterium]|nr:alpha-2-macroglobulin family protein [Pyrinomonadaceae bacterium]